MGTVRTALSSTRCSRAVHAVSTTVGAGGGASGAAGVDAAHPAAAASSVAASRAAGSRAGRAVVLIMGGGRAVLRGRDYRLRREGEGRWLAHTPIATPHTHGSGCTLGAAITAGRARGLDLEAAVVAAKDYVEGGLRRALAIGGGQGPLCHWHALEPRDPAG